MPRPVRKCVFPVGGLGTRFLPATKAMPKEMLPVVDKPLIQYAVEEAAAAGIDHFIFVTGRGKAALEDHFDHNPDLERTLRERGKTVELAAATSWMPKSGEVSYTRQQEPLGLGHAVWCARHLVGDEPFAVILPDDLILARAKGLVEKPEPDKAPSTLSIIGRYILDPSVFGVLEQQTRGAGNEIQLTDALSKTIGDVPFHGLRFEGRRFDCGDKVGWLHANVSFALARPDLHEQFAEVLKEFK